MALTAYMTIQGQHQGQIKGDVTQKGYEFYIAVNGYHQEVTSPRDLASGLPTGKVVHSALAVTKEIDIASIPLMQALTSNENLTEVIIRFFKAELRTGIVKNSYQIRLLNASVSGITQDMLNNMFAENKAIPLMEKILFTYQRIEWTWFEDKSQLTLTDDWAASVA